MIYRELTREEMERIPGVQQPIPDSMFMLGAVNESGSVVAGCGVFTVIHADPLWVREDYRRSPVLLRRLWRATKDAILKRGGSGVQVGMTDVDPGEPTESMIARMCEFAGGHEIEARFFMIPIKD